MKKIVIIGNSKSAELIYSYIRNDTRYKVQAFSVDAKYIVDKTLFGIPVVSFETLVQNYQPAKYSTILAIGYGDLNRNREKIFSRIKEMGYEILTYIHMDARVYSSRIGEGAVIMPSAFIDVHAEIGPNTVVWGNSSIAHHSKIGANCWLATGCVISGDAIVDDNSFVGVNATVVNEVHIGKYNIIGASALIVKNTKEFEVYISRQTEKFRLSASDYLRFAKL